MNVVMTSLLFEILFMMTCILCSMYYVVGSMFTVLCHDVNGNPTAVVEQETGCSNTSSKLSWLIHFLDHHSIMHPDVHEKQFIEEGA